MNILILGAGAIGLAFGGFLANSGQRVILLGRKENIEPINNRGLFIEGIWGNYQVTNIKGYTNLIELKEKEGPDFDLALLTVKSYDTETMLKTFREAYPIPIPTVSLQNGLGNLEQLIRLIGREKAMGGRVIFGAEIPELGKVRVTVYAEEVRVGGVDKGIEYSEVKEIADLFNRAGIPTLPTKEIEKYIWGKVLYNSALNGLGAILGVKYGILMEHETTRKLIFNIVREVFKVLEEENKKVNWPDSKAYVRDLFERLIPATYDHYPSMLRDIQNSKRTEIDAINGAIVKIADQHKFDVPSNWLITKLVKAKEKIARGEKSEELGVKSKKSGVDSEEQNSQ
ncbi:MAG: 2-dehydropantoate 2-reductase [Deltaproteobacteria bacterium]|nr:2-dehydropantoate 2-reductase [Deltaproteobacteria bacterium]